MCETDGMDFNDNNILGYSQTYELWLISGTPAVNNLGLMYRKGYNWILCTKNGMV
jgi:hypothetical protein